MLAATYYARVVDEEEAALLLRESAATAEAAVVLLGAELDERRRAVQVFGALCGERASKGASLSRNDALALGQYQPGWIAVAVFGPDRVETLSAGARAPALTDAWRRLPAVEESGVVARAAPSLSGSDAPYVIVEAPCAEPAEGWVVGALDLAALAGRVFDDAVFPQYRVSISRRGELLWQRARGDTGDADRWGASVDFGRALEGHELRVVPTQELLQSARRDLAPRVRQAGYLLALLLTGLVYGGQRAGSAERRARAEARLRLGRERELQELNAALEDRIAERTQALKRSNEDLEQFAYAASHDLQEPLRMVTSYLQLLQRRYSEPLGQEGNEFVGFAVDGAKRMRALIRGLLQFSRVRTQEVSFHHIELDACAADALANLEVPAAESGAQIELGELGAVLGDRVQLTQLIQNLVSNAIKYGGEAPTVHVWSEERDGALRLYVDDEGIGIAPEAIEQVFDVFVRLHGPSEIPGAGVGLSTCRRIMERHGGTLHLESREVGTRAVAVFPASSGS